MAETLATREQIADYLDTRQTILPTDRSFFVSQPGMYPKDAELKVLLDPVLGLPYPLNPTEEELPTSNGEVANWHHAIHPHDHHILQTIGGKAMRCARIQLVKRTQHNHSEDAYHRLDIGPWIHRNPGHQLGMCIFAAAGAVSSLAIHTEDKKLWLRPMSQEQISQLRIRPAPYEVSTKDVELYQAKKCPELSFEVVEAILTERRERQAELEYRNIRYGYDQMRTFFKTFVMNQDLSNVKPKKIKQFLSTNHEEKGLELLAVAAQEVVRHTLSYNGETIDKVYRQLYVAGRLNPLMPASAAGLINHKLGDVENRKLLVPQLRSQLADAA